VSAPSITAGKLACYGAILIALLALMCASREWLLVGPFFPLLAGSFFYRFEGELTNRAYFLTFLPFVALAWVHPVEGPSELGLDVPFYVSLYLQLVAIRKLAMNATNLPHVIFCAGAGVATIGADMDARPDVSDHRYHLVVAAFAIPFLFAMRGAHERAPLGKRASRYVGLALAFLAVCVLAETSAYVIGIYYEDVSRLIIKSVSKAPLPSPGGFSGLARLGSISGLADGDENDAVALRVFSKTLPGYLRGKSFLDYSKGEWSAETGEREDRPVSGRYVLPGRPLPTGGPTLRVFTDSSYGKHFFLPLQASAVETTSDLVKVFPGGALESPFDSTSIGYGVELDRRAVTGTGSLVLPSDPALLAALDQVLDAIGKTERPVDLVGGIRDYFVKRYAYHFGITFEPLSDPLVQFLTTKHEGHCELFASAGTLLLRRRGVPARYVTGFLCGEKNGASEDLWIARNRHAHAWVEYLDSGDRGAEPRALAWQTAELTPESGMPTFTPRRGPGSWLEALHGVWDRVYARAVKEGVASVARDGLVMGLEWFVTSWIGRGLLLVALVFVGRRVWRRLPKRVARVALRPLPPELEAERRRYLALERALARQGFARRHSETLLEFAARIPAGDAVTVRAYAERRYSPQR
jgi:hypothetical protein